MHCEHSHYHDGHGSVNSERSISGQDFDARRRCDPLVWQRTTESEPRLKRLEADAIRFGAAVRSRRNRWAVWRTITAELRALIGWNGRHPERFTLLDSCYRNLWDRFQGGAA